MVVVGLGVMMGDGCSLGSTRFEDGAGCQVDGKMILEGPE